MLLKGRKLSEPQLFNPTLSYQRHFFFY